MTAARRVHPDTVVFLRAAGCVYAEEEARILTEAAHSAGELRSLLDRRATGEPLEYIVGWAEFCGLRIAVRDGVFVPRRRSEFLAECAIEAVRAKTSTAGDDPRPVRVLDMCCGSGAIGLAIAVRAGNVKLLAADDSPIAVACARENLAPVGGRVYEGDLFGPIPRTYLNGLDLIVANAPYVPTDEIRRQPAEARLYEPAAALDGGPGGTSVQEQILASAAEWLADSGLVMIETGSGMATHTARIAADGGLAVEIRGSRESDATVVVGTRRS